MEKHQQQFSIKAMARVLKVSRSGFYAWRCRQGSPSPRSRRREVRDAEIRSLFAARKGRYGAPRLAMDMADLDMKCDRCHFSA